MTAPREKLLNIPAVVVATLGALALVHAWRMLALTQKSDVEFLLRFAFIPARYDSSLLPGETWPGNPGAEIWTFVSYGLIHADLMHLGFNAAWMLAFGVPVARRFGAMRFLAFMAVTAAAGAGVHLATHAREMFPLVGASAAISGAMAAAMRFAFQRGGPLFTRGTDEAAYRIPALPLLVALRNPRFLAVIGVWFAINLIFGIGAVPLVDEPQSIAWQAHAGGFFAGLVLFGLFDPVREAPPAVA